MVSPATGAVVLITFPFSDLSASKLRPAVVLAAVERDDWVLCQITSSAYADAQAVEIACARTLYQAAWRAQVMHDRASCFQQTHQSSNVLLVNFLPKNISQ